MTGRQGGRSGGCSEQRPFYSKKEVLAQPKWSTMGWQTEGNAVGCVHQRPVEEGLEAWRRYSVRATGNRGPLLVLEWRSGFMCLKEEAVRPRAWAVGLGFTGIWGSHRAPGHRGTSGREQCLERGFGYARGMKCAERRRETSKAHPLLV